MSTNDPTTKRVNLHNGHDKKEEELPTDSPGGTQSDKFLRRWFEVCEYDAVWTTVYLARPRDKALGDWFVNESNDTGSSSSEAIAFATDPRVSALFRLRL